MKLKKKVKIILIVLIIIIVGALGFLGYKKFFATPAVREAKILNTIKDYDYVLKDNKSKKYQTLFKELAKILEEKEVDYEKYVSKLAEMFIVDFYSLNDKTAKTDVGGVDIVHPTALSNFLENAENTYYKYVESNIYNNRKQSLPEVDTVTIDSVEQTSFTFGETIDEEAYSVKVTWNYTDESFSDYQKEATLIFVHDGKKLYLVELN